MDDRIMAAMKAVIAHSHIAQAKMLRERATMRSISRDAGEVLWAIIHAHEAAAHELVESALTNAQT